MLSKHTPDLRVIKRRLPRCSMAVVQPLSPTTICKNNMFCSIHATTLIMRARILSPSRISLSSRSPLGTFCWSNLASPRAWTPALASPLASPQQSFLCTISRHGWVVCLICRQGRRVLRLERGNLIEHCLRTKQSRYTWNHIETYLLCDSERLSTAINKHARLAKNAAAFISNSCRRRSSKQSRR